jgi:tripartite-type tricarboxylate transporter receptor subunit TctC
MKLPRRNFLHLAAGAAALPAVSRFAWAQAYPSRPVRIIVGYPPGGATDAMARLVARQLPERLRPAIHRRQSTGPWRQYRHGGGREVATGRLYAPSDLFSQRNQRDLHDKLSFNFIRDIAPIASIARSPFVMEVHPSVPAKTVPEFVAYAKANPGKIRMASNGNGTTAHVAGELFKLMTGVDIVPYRGELLSEIT